MGKFLLIFLILFLTSRPSIAYDSSSEATPLRSEASLNLENQIKELEGKLTEVRDREKTLFSQIGYMDNQTRLTTLRIAETEFKIKTLEEEIASLSAKIERLEGSLTSLSEILLRRIVATYKRGEITVFHLLFSSSGFGDFLSRAKYIRIVQLHDKRLMYEMQETKDSFNKQKELREGKKAEAENLKKTLENQKNTLARQKKDKEVLLEVTKNDEKRYREMLEAARAERQAFLNILAGGGVVAKLRDIKEGEVIGAMIEGRSPCSTGTHLHFEVQKDQQPVDPANYLKPISLSYDYDTDKIPEFLTPKGSWNWPIAEPVIVEQVFGMSYWARVLKYYGGAPHSGIDLNSETSSLVKTVQDGTLYRGSITCGGGSLQFARVDQKDGIQTYYLHIL